MPLQVGAKQVLHRLAAALLLSTCFTHLYRYIIGSPITENWPVYLSDLAFGTVYFALLYTVYRYVRQVFHIRFSRQRLSKRRFALSLLTFVFVSLLLLWGMRSLYLALAAQPASPPVESQLRLLYVAMASFAFLYFVFLTFLQLTRETQSMSVQAEKLQRERAQAQINILKNQTSPHFLFNTFNTLSSLIYIEEEETTIQFIQELKSVFRYITGNRHRELVELRAELDFVNAYFYLLKIRFRESIQLELCLPESTEGLLLPPLTLQMLLENAVKHNGFSKAAPLCISIAAEDAYLRIRNNLQVRETAGGDSMGIGLQNIINRYRYLTDRQVEITCTGESYTVVIPLLRHA